MPPPSCGAHLPSWLEGWQGQCRRTGAQDRRVSKVTGEDLLAEVVYELTLGLGLDSIPWNNTVCTIRSLPLEVRRSSCRHRPGTRSGQRLRGGPPGGTGVKSSSGGRAFSPARGIAGAHRSLRFGPTATGLSVAMAPQKAQKWRSFRAWKTDLREMNFMRTVFFPARGRAIGGGGNGVRKTAHPKGRRILTIRQLCGSP